MSHTAYSRSNFLKGKKQFFVGEVLQWLSFFFLLQLSGFKSLKLKQYDWTVG